MLLAIVVGGILLLYAWTIFKKPSGLPPGRWGLPLVGYIPMDDKYIDQRLENLQKQYGDIYVWRFGGMVQVYVHDYNICRQMFGSPDFINRPDLESQKADTGSILGVAGSNGAIWHTNRRFSLRQLRDLGMGKSSLVMAVHDQANHLLEELHKTTGKEAPITSAIYTSVVNVIWKMVADKQFKSDDPRIKDLQALAVEANDGFTYAAIADMFAWLQYVIPPSVFRKWFKLDLGKVSQERFFKYFDELIDEHKETLDSNAPKDLIDAYLIEMNESKADAEGLRSMDDLKYLLFDMFLAGSDTTTETLHWIILHLAAFPDKQQNLQEEIDRVLPKGSLATMEDRVNMPYTEAVINEVLRKSSLANFGVHHAAVKDTTLAGYRIPKGAMVTSASHSIHHDERYWDKPNCFLPERWISPEGKFVMKKEGYLPFGTGKRVCIGEGMARMELLVLTTAVFQNFTVSPTEGKQIDLLPDYNNLFGHNARKQDVVFTPRLL